MYRQDIVRKSTDCTTARGKISFFSLLWHVLNNFYIQRVGLGRGHELQLKAEQKERENFSFGPEDNLSVLFFITSFFISSSRDQQILMLFSPLFLHLINNIRVIARSQGPNQSACCTVIPLTTKLTRERNDKEIIPKSLSNFEIRGPTFSSPGRNLVFLSLSTLPLLLTQYPSKSFFQISLVFKKSQHVQQHGPSEPAMFGE